MRPECGTAGPGSQGSDPGEPLVSHVDSQGKKPPVAVWWMVSAAALAAALIAMYAYTKSLEDDFELMLRAALQQYQADAAAPGRRERGEEPLPYSR